MMNATAIKVGAGAWMFTGVVHDILEFVLRGDPAMDAALRASTIQVGPVSLNAESLTRGVSLAMGLAMFVVGLLLWMITRAVPAERLRPFGIVALVASLAALGLAIILIPGPPVITFAVASIAFVIALATRSRNRSGTQPLPAAAR
ncbi:LIC_13387 family protein [Microlunatus parietis]|uniref:Uncharacterized protein n=1 Tax=Microlunatus parietis TaxID=682979 RepID=A0A7Y9LB81_9ACTN|nr:hypothetical protein [Microlunatus parietis]NYE69541.1 hypothetical protein [Microlunatus parietis]